MHGEHAVIIGAGAGGASLAIRLARAGVRATIIEAKPFPRAKVCGEFISPAATRDLEDLIPPRELLGAGASRVDSLALELGTLTRNWPMPEPAWALSRRTLDQELLERATHEGATVLQPERAAQIDYHTDSVEVTLASGPHIRADLVIHADGIGRLDRAGPTPNARGLVGLKCHARPTDPIRGIRMRAHAGAYCGAIGIENGLATYAMCATPKALARHDGDRDALLAEIWPGFDSSLRDGEWMACGVARSAFIPAGHPRSFRIGNAAAAVDPVGGEGIGLAIWSAARLCELLTQSPASLNETHRRYAALYKKRIRSRRPACRLAAELLLRPKLLNAAWPLLAAPTLTIAPWYHLTGKPLRKAQRA